MKKTLLFSALIPAALLLSFTFQQKGFKKTGNNLYSISTTKSLAGKDSKQLQKIIADRYGITDFTKDVEIGPDNAVNLKSKWIFHKKAVLSVISESLIKYDKLATIAPDADAKRVQLIVAKYSKK